MIQKLRGQLLLAFLLFSVVNSIFIISYLVQKKYRNEIEKAEDYTHQIQVLVQENTKNINDFFTYETKKPDYFITHQSKYLDQYKTTLLNIDQSISYLTKNKVFKRLNANELIRQINCNIDSIEHIMDTITLLIYERGFKDYGIEGQMRNYAHELEKSHFIELSDLLMLRRHEKDYIIRNEEKYIKGFNQLNDAMRVKLKLDPALNVRIKDSVLKELNLYKSFFNQMVWFDSVIGIKDNTALKTDLEQVTHVVLQNVDQLNNQCHFYKTLTYRKHHWVNIIILFLSAVFSIFLSFKLSKLVTNRVSLLSENISDFIANKFTENKPVVAQHQMDEVGRLIRNFELLKQEIIDQINFLEVKVAERTEEINTQKEQILEQNVKILDSLRYALNIQEAVLPHKNYIGETFPEHFVFYRPKDLVSGDFYWYKHIQKKNKEYSVLVVADCTGHGVPGAFMSMLGIAFVSEVVSSNSVKNSGKLLDKVRDRLLDSLAHQNNSKNVSDGMDMALVIIDHTEQKLQFSGAFRDLVIVRNGELITLQGNRMPIGKHVKSDDQFSTEEFAYLKNDLIYMFTDGFADQQGGEMRRKFLRKNLKKMLVDISSFPLDQQKLLVERELNGWMGRLDQTDDILLAGFKLTH